MKRSIQLIVILAASLLTSSCAEGDAREYARKLAALLASYSQQIEKKLADEEARYVDEAKQVEEAIERDEANALAAERRAQSRAATQQLIAGTLQPAAFLHDTLAAYAKKDFDQNEAVYVKDQDAYTSHLKSLTHLSLEKAKIQGLQQALEGLGKQLNLVAQIEEYGKFGDELRKQIQQQTCSAAAATVKAKTELIATLTAGADPAKDAKLAIAQADLDGAQALLKKAGCP